jgi:hypothetical protein
MAISQCRAICVPEYPVVVFKAISFDAPILYAKA